MNDIPWNFFVVAAGAALLWLFLTWRRQHRRQAVKTALAAGAKLVDVRSREEFNSGHHPRAIHIPHDRIAAKAASLGPKDSLLVLYCASGSRAGLAASQLKAAGFSRVLNAGGYADLPAD